MTSQPERFGTTSREGAMSEKPGEDKDEAVAAPQPKPLTLDPVVHDPVIGSGWAPPDAAGDEDAD